MRGEGGVERLVRLVGQILDLFLEAGTQLLQEPEANNTHKVNVPLSTDRKRRRGRPRTTWRRTVESEIKNMKYSWGSLTRLAQGGGTLLLPYTPLGVMVDDDELSALQTAPATVTL